MHLLLLILTTCPATLAERDAFTVCYDTQNQRAIWTSHTPKPSINPTPRKHWRQDHELNSLSASVFTNSGFDRGHLATAADLPDSEDAFLTSNAIAQDPRLNRGEWRRLENQIRKQNPVKVITGAIYANCGNEKIEAPCYLSKIAHLPDGQIFIHFAENSMPRPCMGQRSRFTHNACANAAHGSGPSAEHPLPPEGSTTGAGSIRGDRQAATRRSNGGRSEYWFGAMSLVE